MPVAITDMVMMHRTQQKLNPNMIPESRNSTVRTIIVPSIWSTNEKNCSPRCCQNWVSTLRRKKRRNMVRINLRYQELGQVRNLNHHIRQHWHCVYPCSHGLPWCHVRQYKPGKDIWYITSDDFNVDVPGSDAAASIQSLSDSLHRFDRRQLFTVSSNSFAMFQTATTAKSPC